MFAFTAAVNRASRRYQWNAKRPTNVMTGTLYISSLRYEWNVWSLFRRKAADVLRYYRAFPNTSATVDVFRRSATDLDCLPDRSVDMVFMDVQLPGMSGIDTTAAIRARDQRTGRRIPIVAMTAHAMAGDRERFLAAGMDDYISKPIGVSELLAAGERATAAAA